jgi:hypothetical protein
MSDARNDAKYELALEVLRSFGGAQLPVTGASMLPALWPGDLLEVHRESAAKIFAGDVVVFRREGRLVAHRVVEKLGWPDGTVLVTRGDRLEQTDPPVSPEELLGRVTWVRRGHRRLGPRLTLWGRATSWVLRRSDFCARLLLRFNRLFTTEAQRH